MIHRIVLYQYGEYHARRPMVPTRLDIVLMSFWSFQYFSGRATTNRPKQARTLTTAVKTDASQVIGRVKISTANSTTVATS